MLLDYKRWIEIHSKESSVKQLHEWISKETVLRRSTQETLFGTGFQKSKIQKNTFFTSSERQEPTAGLGQKIIY